MHVLLIEDCQDDARRIRELLAELKLAGVQLESVRSLDDARGSFAHLPYDVILLDLSLPESSGLATLRRAQTLIPGIPIIVVTGSADATLAATAVREGAQDFLVKGQVTGELLWRSIKYAIERHQAEEALRQERDFAENLIDAAQTIVLLVDLEGKIVRFNRYLEQVSGYRLEEVWRQDWLTTFFSPADHERGRMAFAGVLRGQSVRGVLAPLGTRHGDTRDVQWFGRTINDAKQCTVGILYIGHDITELREAQTRALRSERLAAIGQMVAGLAHESRNALQRSQACIERLGLRIAEQPEALDLLARIQKAQDHLKYLYDQVGEYAAPIKLVRRPHALGEILTEAWNSLAPRREGRRATMVQLNEDPGMCCHVDCDALEQVFRNILENALAACADPVEIRVRWNDESLEGQPAVQVSLRDNGPGLTLATREKMFEPFFTTKTHGMGLGMAIAKRLVEAHGGRLAVGDAALPGAELLVQLPKGTP
jgi:PAS domain S-box-containing protein